MVISKSVGRRAALLCVTLGLALSGCSFHYSSRSSSHSGSGKQVGHGSSGKGTSKPISKGDGGGGKSIDEDPPAKGDNPDDPPTKGDNEDEATADPHRTKPVPHRTKPAAHRKKPDAPEQPADDDSGSKPSVIANPDNGGGGVKPGSGNLTSNPKGGGGGGGVKPGSGNLTSNPK